MNLTNRSSGDWDVLTQDTGLFSLNEGSEDQGWDSTLFFGEYTPTEVEAVVGKRRAKIQYRRLAAEVLHLEWALGIPREMETIVEIPLGILVADSSFVLECSLGISRRSHEIEMEVPLSQLRWNLSDLEISIPLAVSHSLSMDFEIPIGKTVEKSMKRLKRLKKFLESL